MESQTVKLAKKIAVLLKNEDYREATKALQMAKILLPTAADRRKLQKAKEKQEEESMEGSLVPADEDIMKFSKAMSNVEPSEAVAPEPEME